MFGVGLQMLVYRCRDLRIINDELYRELFREFKDTGWRDPPFEVPAPVPVERSRRFQRLCLRAIAQRVVESRGAEFMNMSVHELDRLMDGADANL